MTATTIDDVRDNRPLTLDQAEQLATALQQLVASSR